MADAIIEGAKIAGAAAGGGILGALLATIRMQARMMLRRDCRERQEACMSATRALLQGMAKDIAAVREEIKQIRKDIYIVRGSK